MPTGRPKTPLVLTAEDREQLESWNRWRSLPSGLVNRARIVLLSDQGVTNQEISQRLGLSMPTVKKWRDRFITCGLEGLYDELRLGRPRSISDDQIAALLQGVVLERYEGTPQGGPLSPLLASILLHDLDQELARRGRRFSHYANDCSIYVRSQRTGERVMASVRRFLERKLRLRVNEEKSAVARPREHKLLGYRLVRQRGETRLSIAPASL